MEHSDLTPLYESGLQVNYRPHLASGSNFLEYPLALYLGDLDTTPKRLQSVDAYFAERQNQYGLVRTHGRETSELTEWS